MEDMKAELARRVKPQYAKMNVLALELGLLPHSQEIIMKDKRSNLCG